MRKLYYSFVSYFSSSSLTAIYLRISSRIFYGLVDALYITIKTARYHYYIY